MVNGFSFTSFGGGNEGTLQGPNVIKESLEVMRHSKNMLHTW